MKQEQGKDFNYEQKFDEINFRENPGLYRVGRGEQGVLMVEPYKSEILPYWRFKTPEIATESSEKIYQLFLDYLEKEDFVGADMARKFLQMGYTRSRRYANHKSGKKYKHNPQHEATWEEEKQARKKFLLPHDPDPIKARSAEIFKVKWHLAKENKCYKQMMEAFKKKYGTGTPKKQ